jgi:hypothetical protein
MPGKDTNIGAKRARDTRAALGLPAADPVDVLAVVETRAALPVIVARLPEGIAGACWRDGPGAVLWVNGDQPVVRQRFTLGHELGHVRCGHPATPVDAVAVLAGDTHDPREVQANAFAAEFLAPRAGVDALVDGEPDLETVVRIAGRFGISTAAALFRLRTLGLTTRFERLRRELDDGLHRYLDPPPHEDALSRIDALPRLSPALAGSHLAAMLAGTAPAQGLGLLGY